MALQAAWMRGDGRVGLRFSGLAGDVVADRVVFALPFTVLRFAGEHTSTRSTGRSDGPAWRVVVFVRIAWSVLRAVLCAGFEYSPLTPRRTVCWAAVGRERSTGRARAGLQGRYLVWLGG